MFEIRKNLFAILDHGGLLVLTNKFCRKLCVINRIKLEFNVLAHFIIFKNVWTYKNLKGPNSRGLNVKFGKHICVTYQNSRFFLSYSTKNNKIALWSI